MLMTLSRIYMFTSVMTQASYVWPIVNFCARYYFTPPFWLNVESGGFGDGLLCLWT